jgi:ABC-type oligopeptide transport system substrate-binding subunit
VQIYSVGWSADYPDAENFLQLLYGPNDSPGPNNSHYHNSEYDKLYEQSLTLLPGERRNQIYKKMRDQFVRDMPWIPEVHRTHCKVYHSWLRNFKPNAMIVNPYKYLRINIEEKKVQKARL